VSWPHSFFICYRTSEAKGIGPFIPALQCQFKKLSKNSLTEKNKPQSNTRDMLHHTHHDENKGRAVQCKQIGMIIDRTKLTTLVTIDMLGKKKQKTVYVQRLRQSSRGK